jgi:hypothetical protein
VRGSTERWKIEGVASSEGGGESAGVPSIAREKKKKIRMATL